MSDQTATLQAERPRDAATIAAQNDLFRSSLGETPDLPGQMVMTQGVAALTPIEQLDVIRSVARFDTFDEDNDPHGEHDFGAFEVKGKRLFWKLDLYANDLQHGSDDPTNPKETYRILTIMLAGEY